MFHRALPFVLLCLAGSAATAQGSIPVRRAEIVRSYPHDRTIFTEGLFYRDGALYESSGLRGRSSVRRVRIEDGRAETPGSAARHGVRGGYRRLGRRDHRRHLAQRRRLSAGTRRRSRPRKRFSYRGEGWGLTRDEESLILSDGSPVLRFLDPATFLERRRLRVTAGGKPVRLLNELEWVDGEIYANVWKTNRIARIDPATGRVKAWIDLTELDLLGGGQDGEDVLNGIAWDAVGQAPVRHRQALVEAVRDPAAAAGADRSGGPGRRTPSNG